MTETYEVLKRAAGQLRDSAAVLRAVVKARGDVDGRLAAAAVEHWHAADELDAAAESVRPSRAVLAWGRGNGEAMKNYWPPDCDESARGTLARRSKS